jgi:hypothetical protein
MVQGCWLVLQTVRYLHAVMYAGMLCGACDNNCTSISHGSHIHFQVAPTSAAAWCPTPLSSAVLLVLVHLFLLISWFVAAGTLACCVALVMSTTPACQVAYLLRLLHGHLLDV